jgi:hypothetical protein
LELGFAVRACLEATLGGDDLVMVLTHGYARGVPSAKSQCKFVVVISPKSRP